MASSMNFSPAVAMSPKPAASPVNQSFGKPMMPVNQSLKNAPPLFPSQNAPAPVQAKPVVKPVTISSSNAAEKHISNLGNSIKTHVDSVNTQAANKAAASTNPVSTTTNAQGLTPQQMSDLATKQMQDRTIAASQANPGQLQVGAQTGAFPTAAGNQPITFQAMTGNTAPPGPGTSPGELMQGQQPQAPTAPATPSTTGTQTSTTDQAQAAGASTSGSTSLQDQLTSLNAQTDRAWSDYNSKIQSIQNGTFPLNPLQQATLNSITNNFNQLRQQQLIANQNYTAAITQAGVTSGRSRYAPEIEAGNIMQAVNTGIAKLAKIDADASQALVEAQTAFQKEDYAEATTAFEMLEKHLDAKTDQLSKMMELSQKAAESAQKQAMEMEKFKYQQEQDAIANTLKFGEFDAKQKQQAFDQIMQSDKFDYQQKKDAIDQQIASDKFTWQQKQDMIKNALDQGKFSYEQKKDLRNYQLDLAKMAQADTTTTYKDWKLAGMPGTYADFLKNEKINAKPPTQDQSQSATYATRMKDSGDTITRLTDWFSKQGLGGQAWAMNAPNFLQSAEGQQLEQAERDFVNAVLRKESGAAIGAAEFDNAKRQYFPEPGDGPEKLALKERARKNALQGITNEAGPALSDAFKKMVESGKMTYPSLDDYAKFNPDQISVIDKMGQEHPNWSDDDILQILQGGGDEGQSSGFNQVGGDTYQAAGNADLDRTAEAIGKYESGGRYNALGPVLPSGSYAGDRAYGKYQIMGKNIPSWTKQALGYSMSPQQFLKDTEAQDKTAKYFMKKHLDQYGRPEDVASIWLSGKPMAGNKAQDLATGVTVPQYVKNVMKYYNES